MTARWDRDPSVPVRKRTTRKALPTAEQAKPVCSTCRETFASMRRYEAHADESGHLRCEFPVP